MFKVGDRVIYSDHTDDYDQEVGIIKGISNHSLEIQFDCDAQNITRLFSNSGKFKKVDIQSTLN